MKKIIWICLFSLLCGCTSRSEPVGMANPFSDFDTLQQAEESAGFSMNLPEKIGEYTISIYRTQPGKMLEVLYVRENQKIRVRKTQTEEDISGYYGEAESKDIPMQDIVIHAVLQQDQVINAYWIHEGCSYSFSCDQGVSEQILMEFADVVMQQE